MVVRAAGFAGPRSVRRTGRSAAGGKWLAPLLVAAVLLLAGAAAGQVGELVLGGLPGAVLSASLTR